MLNVKILVFYYVQFIQKEYVIYQIIFLIHNLLVYLVNKLQKIQNVKEKIQLVIIYVNRKHIVILIKAF